MPTLMEIESQLTGPNGACEVVEEPVLGVPMEVFKRRARSLRELLAASERHGEREYLVFDHCRLTFPEHVRRVACVARALEQRFGVSKGDRVAILAANCPEWILCFWASVSLGAIAVGLNGWWAGDEIRYALDDCEPALLIGDRARLARIAGGPVRVPVVEIESEFDDLLGRDDGAPLPGAEIDEDDPATILYTSGTTGRPKGAVNTHRGIIALNTVQLFHGLRMLMSAGSAGVAPDAEPAPEPCTLVTTPLFHVSGLYTGAVTPLSTGVKTVWTTGRFDPVRVMELIERERVTTWGPMGTMAWRVVRHPDFAKYDLSSLRHLGSGGAPVSPELQAEMRRAFEGARGAMGVGYGLTECTALATLNYGADLERHPGSVGRPLATVRVEIRDERGRPAPEGCEGEIHIRSPLVMKEYWRRPEDTAHTILAGRWLRTGDWGRLVDGRLYVDSRKRDLILRGGENVYPIEIEQRIEAHPDVQEAAVVGVPSEELGQEVKAIVVPRPGAELDTGALARFVAETLAYFKVPSQWEVRASPLPRNATGKVMKHVLIGEGESPFVGE